MYVPVSDNSSGIELIEGHNMDPIPPSDSSSVCDTSVDDPITPEDPEDDVEWVEGHEMDPCPF